MLRYILISAIVGCTFDPGGSTAASGTPDADVVTIDAPIGVDSPVQDPDADPVPDADPSTPDAMPPADADLDAPDADVLACDVLADTCGGGLACYWEGPGSGHDGLCAPPGTKLPGQSCIETIDCTPGAACAGSFCYRLCDAAMYGGETTDPRCGGKICGLFSGETEIGGCV